MRLIVSLHKQQADLIDDAGVCVRRYPVSTSALGAGERKDSLQTPRGRHLVRAKIGADQPVGAVFVARRPTGEIHSDALQAVFPDRDWILTRILWLSGCEVGLNRRGQCDTMQRYIYIHGTPSSAVSGQPASKGCIRMTNDDIAELFELLPCFSPVVIEEN